MNKETKYAIGGLIAGIILTLAVHGVIMSQAKNKHGIKSNNYHSTTGHSGAMSESMDMMTGSLKGKTGDEFDKAFLSEMITHHEGAVDMANLVLTNAKHQEIKDLAKAIISAQTTEINQMKQWQIDWYGNK